MWMLTKTAKVSHFRTSRPNYEVPRYLYVQPVIFSQAYKISVDAKNIKGTLMGTRSKQADCCGPRVPLATT